MTQYFNTGSPIFGGLEFTNAEEILSLIQASLLQANWVVTSDEIIENLEKLLAEKAKSDKNKASIFDLNAKTEGDIKFLNEAKKNEKRVAELNDKINR